MGEIAVRVCSFIFVVCSLICEKRLISWDGGSAYQNDISFDLNQPSYLNLSFLFFPIHIISFIMYAFHNFLWVSLLLLMYVV